MLRFSYNSCKYSGKEIIVVNYIKQNPSETTPIKQCLSSIGNKNCGLSVKVSNYGIWVKVSVCYLQTHLMARVQRY